MQSKLVLLWRVGVICFVAFVVGCWIPNTRVALGPSECGDGQFAIGMPLPIHTYTCGFFGLEEWLWSNAVLNLLFWSGTYIALCGIAHKIPTLIGRVRKRTEKVS